MTADFSDPAVVHVPVLQREVVRAFDFGRPGVIIDGTLGPGGHAEALLAAHPELRLIGVDLDPEAVRAARERLQGYGGRFEATEGSYADLRQWLADRGLDGIDGLLLDLGLSSNQIEEGGRGFSFLRPGPMDMRFSPGFTRSAWDLLVAWSPEQLAQALRAYGEEPAAGLIARRLKAAIAQGRLRNDALQVAEFIRGLLPHARGIHPATRTFQALRIAVNHELESLERILADLPAVLNRGGRAAIISFHSLEDRRVKNAFRQAAFPCVCPPRAPVCVCGRNAWGRLLSRQAIRPVEEEMQRNPRARSARMRLLERL